MTDVWQSHMVDLISRIVGEERIVDEFLFSFIHDSEMAWILPGVEPTGWLVNIPVSSRRTCTVARGDVSEFPCVAFIITRY
ncbi:hypothetical protein [Rhizobium sullae]|uniref:Uncharacterized protein n=1 Tax=Rhizobium sullae TaxID=50338 RepID=A0A2N0DGM7_RHISU|nr:hypothetical protein [Rhizobium sullae]PKA45261.1 hypothetical protein CWR43_05640 [Rhizobium sullae]